MAYIPVALRQAVMERARHCCEYCRSPQIITGELLHVEHIFPESLGGLTTLHNLACACARCNLHKATRTHFYDPHTKNRVHLFNPRRQRWRRHFAWDHEGLLIVGRTAVGRATVDALHMNDTEIVTARFSWIILGVHPTMLG